MGGGNKNVKLQIPQIVQAQLANVPAYNYITLPEGTNKIRISLYSFHPAQWLSYELIASTILVSVGSIGLLENRDYNINNDPAIRNIYIIFTDHKLNYVIPGGPGANSTTQFGLIKNNQNQIALMVPVQQDGAGTVKIYPVFGGGYPYQIIVECYP